MEFTNAITYERRGRMAKNKQRESFTFYKSFEDGICRLSDAEQLQVYRAISRYSLFGERPVLDGYAGMAWAFIEPILRKARIGFENGVKGSEYGKLGGNPNFQKGKRNTSADKRSAYKRRHVKKPCKTASSP